MPFHGSDCNEICRCDGSKNDVVVFTVQTDSTVVVEGGKTYSYYAYRHGGGGVPNSKVVGDFLELENTTVERYSVVFFKTGQPSHCRT